MPQLLAAEIKPTTTVKEALSLPQFWPIVQRLSTQPCGICRDCRYNEIETVEMLCQRLGVDMADLLSALGDPST
jgi:hypothetical protein